MAGTNWWQYGKWVYNIGRTGKYLPYSTNEGTAAVTFINAMVALRPSLLPRVQLKIRNPEKTLAEQDSESLGGMLQVIGRSLRVNAASDAEKALCDALFTAMGDRKNRIATKKVTLTLSATPSGYGTATGGGEYPLNSTATAVATPASGYEFSEWADGVKTASRSVVMTSDISLTAVFVEEGSSSDSGSGSDSSSSGE